MRSSSAAWLVAGGRLDRYDLLLPVAEGGMAVLWLARQHGKHGFDKLVAIKTISPRLASDPGFQRMFMDEARVVSRIEHPNVAQVLDLGEESGVLFLVMEWVDGDSIINASRAVARPKDTQIPVGILARVAADACAGLHAAHELVDDEGRPLNVVHRDVSPHNLLVGFRGTTKVIDFGIAKASNRIAHDTTVGVIKGKLAYMSPEQAMGQPVDRRADVWSTGAVMYRFLTGRVPYTAADPVAVLRRIMEGKAVAPLPSTIPGPIRGVVERALARDPKERFETSAAMRGALESAMRAAKLDTTTEDVAAFMSEHLGEVRAKRTRDIDDAMRESRARMRAHAARAESDPDLASPRASTDLASGSHARPPEVESDSSDVDLGALAVEPAGSDDADDSSDVRRTPIGAGRPSLLPTVVVRALPMQVRPEEHVEETQGHLEETPGHLEETPGRLEGTQGHLEETPGHLEEPPADAVATPPISVQPVTEALEAREPIPIPLVTRTRSRRLVARAIAVSGAVGALVTCVVLWRPAQRSPARVATADHLASIATSAAPPKGVEIGPPPVPVPPTAPPTATVAPLAEPAPAVHPAAEARAVAIQPLDPTVADHASTAAGLAERARLARRAGRGAEAEALFAAAVARDPSNSEALTDLAGADRAQGATATAIANYRRAIAVNPRYVPARVGLADSLWDSGQRAEAQSAYRGLVDQFPADLCPDRARERASVGAAGKKP